MPPVQMPPDCAAQHPRAAVRGGPRVRLRVLQRDGVRRGQGLLRQHLRRQRDILRGPLPGD